MHVLLMAFRGQSRTSFSADVYGKENTGGLPAVISHHASDESYVE